MATAAADAVFLDTNILVYASVAESPFHAAAMNALGALAQAGVELWISRQVLREYLATLTRPQAFTPPLPSALLTSAVRDFQRRFRVAEDDPAVTEALLRLLEQLPVGGRQVHDANIVATMQAYGVSRLLTANVPDFARFAHLITLVPLAGRV
jgi:predicted nucleic acid-binding protein